MTQQYPGEAPNPGLQPQPTPIVETPDETPEERDQRQRDRIADRPDGGGDPVTADPEAPAEG